MQSYEDDQEARQPHGELHRAVRGGTRSAIATQVVSQLISLCVLSALYRLISPEEFGVFAIALLLVMLPRTFVTLGLNAAAIQKTDISGIELTAIFWWNLTLGIVASVITVVSVLMAYQVQQSLDILIVGEALSGSALVASLGLTHQMLLERHLKIATLNRARIAAQMLAGFLAVASAYYLRLGIWSLVIQHYTELICLTILFWLVERWVPNLPSQTASVRGLLRFGGFFSLSSLFFYVALNVDKLILYVLIGSTSAGKAAIGMYQQASNFMMRSVLAVTTPVSAVMLPALSRAQEHQDLRDRLLVDFNRLIGILLIPASVGLTLVAKDTMLVMGGTRWLEAGWLLGALAPAMAMQGLINLCGSMMTAANRTREMFWGSVCLTIVMIQGYLAGFYFGRQVDPTPIGSTLGLAYGYTTVTVVVLFLPYCWYCARTAGIALTSILVPLLPTLGRSIAMGISVYLVRRYVEGLSWAPLPRLLLLVLSGVVVYTVLARQELKWLIRQLQNSARP